LAQAAATSIEVAVTATRAILRALKKYFDMLLDSFVEPAELGFAAARRIDEISFDWKYLIALDSMPGGYAVTPCRDALS
jgi:hypothetical protein